MTLNIAAQGSDFVVLGSDSRGVFGDYRTATATIDTMIKSSKAAEHVGIQISGAAEIGDAMLDEFLTIQAEKKVDGITPVMNEFRAFIQNKCNDYFKNIPFEKQPTMVFTIAGFDKKASVFDSPRVYSLMSQFGFAPNLHRYGYACMGIPQYAIYIFNRRYSPQIDIEGLKGLVVYAIAETATQEQRVGGQIRLSVITPKGFTELSKADVDKILKAWYEKTE